ncbi:unnamed protein product [Prunus armeniaca]|uniref:Retrotransposon gag domain-containing protein n=1 Tax=Prunus armeniaca TaxID=36596 RepID=A0A6J5TH45_PRUAR|nr:unnamed protein product [Prunus armeniaca]
MTSWINGKKHAPSSDAAAYAEWKEDNCLVQSWLLNSMTKPVRALFEHGDTAFDIWEAARKTYTVTQNSSWLFQLRRQSILTCQNDESVKVFYEKLHAVWQKIDCMHPHEFNRILALCPVSPSLEAYVMVMEEDTRQSPILGRGSMALKVDPARQ